MNGGDEMNRSGRRNRAAPKGCAPGMEGHVARSVAVVIRQLRSVGTGNLLRKKTSSRS